VYPSFEGSGRGGIESLGGEALAALFRLKISLSLRISDFFDSSTEATGGVDLASGLGVVAFLTANAGIEVFASSTSPSSTSVVAKGFGVGAPRELR
jgi:hypothetical protein